MRRIRRIRQHDYSDCGAACLCCIARAFGYRLPVSKIRELASTGRTGTNIMGLIEAAEKMGFIAKGIKGPRDALNSAPVPSIAHLESKPNFFHFVVLSRIGKNYVRYMDPDGGCLKKIRHTEMQEHWTGVLVVLAPGPGFHPKNENPSLSARFLELVRPFRQTLQQAILGAVLFSLLGLSTSFFVQKIMDFVLVNRNLNLLNLLGVSMTGLLVFRILISWFKSIFLLKAGHQVDAGLILGYYRHLLGLPQRFFDTMRTGEILSRMNDAIKIRVFINHSLIELAVALLTILFTILAMALLCWQLSLLVIVALPVFTLVYLIFDRINKKVLRNLMEETAGLESQLVESLQTQRTIRSFGWQAWAKNRTADKVARVLRVNYRAGMANIFTGHAGEFISGLMTIILLWIGSSKVIEGWLSPGELMSFYAMLGYLLGPVKNLGDLNRIMRDALIAADRLFQIMDLELEKNRGSGIRIDGLHDDIRFCNVVFRYGSRPELFRDLSFCIPRGKLTGIVGRSGSGKSSIAAMLGAEYLPESGRIMINQCDIRQVERTSLRRLIGIIPQHIELFSGSILENIVPGEGNPDAGKLLKMATFTGLMGFVNRLPEGFYTELGELGLSLSGGERQRIALTRALYRKPEMLIMDEATSALDPLSEAEILDLIRKLRASGMTLVIISHKLSLVKDADHIVLVDGGRAAESGRHRDLIRSRGLYSRLWSAQQEPGSMPGQKTL